MTSRTPAAVLAMLMLAGTAGIAAAQTATPDAAAEAATAAQDAAQAAQDAASAASDATAAAAEGASGTAAAAADAAAEAASNAQAAAQQATAATPAPAAAAPAAATGEPQPGQYYTKQSFDDWTMRCIKTDTETDPCELYQLLKDGAGTSVAEFTLIPLTGGQVAAGATVVTPLETDLTRGLGIQIDKAQAKLYPFAFCAPVGCVARVGLPQVEIDSMKRGSVGVVSVLPYGQNPDTGTVQLTLSLKGFTAALTELQKMQPNPN